MMDDDNNDSCEMKYIEVIPLDNYSADVKLSPSYAEVGILTL